MKTFTLSFLAAFVVAVAMAGEATAQVCNTCRSKTCRNCANHKCQCGHGAHGRSACVNGACGNGRRQGNGPLGYGVMGHGPRITQEQYALSYPWHCNYYHAEWGSPVALVVPPTAEKQWNMGWGVSNDRLSRIYHQFGRAYPGEYVGGGEGQQFLPTPRWPSDTSQFGVYYVRGPW